MKMCFLTFHSKQEASENDQILKNKQMSVMDSQSYMYPAVYLVHC